MVNRAKSDTLADLRQQAEKVLQRQQAELREIPPEEVQRLIHELRVHQIELEMQNEELRRAQQELGRSRDRYLDLYDLAPVGYVTLVGFELIQDLVEYDLRGELSLHNDGGAVTTIRFSAE